MPEYYVAVDFGSESMAACYVREGMNEPQDIQLQERGDSSSNGYELLLEPDGKPSPRLRTRIALTRKDLNDAVLAEQRTCDLDHSAFAYFHQPLQEYVRSVLPNLKLLYQTAAIDLLPEGAQKIKAEAMLGTVVLQILSQLVFAEKDFVADVAKQNGTLRGSDIHLLLTIPNVYSTSHASKLRRFVAEHLRIGDVPLASVDTIYESDAITHYLWWSRDPVPPSLVGIFSSIKKAGATRRKCNIITVDVGRGTTDVSFFTFEKRNDEWCYDLKARTGRAHGGGRLTYLIANAIDDEIEEIYSKMIAGAPDEGTRKKLQENRFRLTRRATTGQGQEMVVVSLVERYIETIKRNWHQRPADGTSTKKEIDEIISRFKAVFKDEIPAQALDELCGHLSKALAIPDLPLTEALSFWKALRGKAKTSEEKRRGFAGLENHVREYVRENSDEVLSWMEEMAVAGENAKDFRSLLKDTETIVLVAGQASQFQLLREAITSRVRSWDKNVEPGGNLVFLEGAEAKYACCHGAVMQHALGIRNVRPDRIHGSYGFLGMIVDDEVKLVDMKLFQVENAPLMLKPSLAARPHHFVYTPRVLHSEATSGALAYLWEIPSGGEVEVTNLGGGGIGLKYQRGGQPKETVTDAAAFGDVRTPGEDIYTRSWPEVLKPR